ncbi:MAG: GGDEF domain-containing protein [Pseudomonadota bacterium]
MLAVILRSPYFIGVFSSVAAALAVFNLWGEPKSSSAISWLDVVSELGMAALAIFWLAMLVRSRPGGRVTRLLALGLCGIVFSWTVDVIDEFIRLPKDLVWQPWLESLPIPVALICLSLGIYHWHEEQLAITRQRAKRERFFRDHTLFDDLAAVGTATYLREQIRLAVADAARDSQPVALVAIDLLDFEHIHRIHGPQVSDDVIQTVCELLVMNLRQSDLICRLAGDRFVVVMPNTNEYQARIVAAQFEDAVLSLAYKPGTDHERLFLRAAVAVTMGQTDDSDVLIRNLNEALSQSRQATAQ